MALSLLTPVGEIKGIGPKKEKALADGGIRTVRDLLWHFPKRYRSGKCYPVSSERCGSYAGFALTVISQPSVAFGQGGRRFLRFLAEDENHTRVTLLFFHQIYLKDQIHKGDLLYCYGVLQEKKNAFYLFSPERFDKKPDPEKLYPIYSPVGSVTGKQIEKWIGACLVPTLGEIAETLPDRVVSDNHLMGLAEAVFHLHCPTNENSLKRAKARFSFEGFFDFSVKAKLFSRSQSTVRIPAFPKSDTKPFIRSLPFSLTAAQLRVIDEIRRDLTGSEDIPPMHRLIQGDVGSGKTAVCAAAAYLTAINKKSTLMMAPTEILAEQHAKTFSRFMAPFSIPVLLLTGSTKAAERKAIRSITCSDRPYILIGTHALLEENALCHNVGLTVTDEQHRFGVRQRNLFGEKGGAFHSLVMSATPIPRSLAMFLYAKGSISIIDELPPGRKNVKTCYIGEQKMPELYGFLSEEYKKGHKAYIVCPLIEEGEDGGPDLQSAAEEFAAVKKELPAVPSLFLHGKMKHEEKKAVMDQFRNTDAGILVSTTVIEVGVDVPEATVMVIRNAERFGLSQLHQLRGRVGRGKDLSFCFLVSSHTGKAARERLKKLSECHDGFQLAEYDLRTRGPGEFFGTRQSGFSGAEFTDDLSLETIREASLAADFFLEKASPEELRCYEKDVRLN